MCGTAGPAGSAVLGRTPARTAPVAIGDDGNLADGVGNAVVDVKPQRLEHGQVHLFRKRALVVQEGVGRGNDVVIVRLQASTLRGRVWLDVL